MDKEKEIAKITKALAKGGLLSESYNKSAARVLVEAGYRRTDEVSKETAKEILDNLYRYPHEYHEKRILELAKKFDVEVDE